MERIHEQKMDLCASISKLFMDPFTDPWPYLVDPSLVLKISVIYSMLYMDMDIDNKFEELVVKPVLSIKHAWRRKALMDGFVVVRHLFEDRAAMMADFMGCGEVGAARLLAMYSDDFVDRPLRIWCRYVIMSDDMGSCGDASVMSRLPVEVRSQILEAVLKGHPGATAPSAP